MPGYYYRLWSNDRSAFGKNSPPDQGLDIWLHAASLGEVNLARTLVAALLAKSPKLRIILTSNTASGLHRALSVKEEICGKYKTALIYVHYAPYDLPPMISSFLDKFNPRVLVLLEAEIWRNWCGMCRKRGVRVLSINARLGSKSLKKRLRFSFIMPPAFAMPNIIGVQSKEDKQRFLYLYKKLGADIPRIRVCGNIKFDAVVEHIADGSANGKTRIPSGAERVIANETGFNQQASSSLRLIITLLTAYHEQNISIWCGGSTHHPEEKLLINARRQIKKPNLLILAPRHQQRFNRLGRILAAQAAKESFIFFRMSELIAMPSNELPYKIDVILLDTIGDLPYIYPFLSFAFIGGSFTRRGGQNILEPLAAGVAVILGPRHHNLASLVKHFDKDCLALVKDEEELSGTISNYAQDSYIRTKARHAPQIIKNQAGASSSGADLILSCLQAKI